MNAPDFVIEVRRWPGGEWHAQESSGAWDAIGPDIASAVSMVGDMIDEYLEDTA